MGYSRDGIYLNQTALTELELSESDQVFKQDDESMSQPILGVVNDFNFSNLKKPIGPMMIHQLDQDSYANKIFFKVNSQDLANTIDKIKSAYLKVTNLPVEIQYMDDTIRQWYVKEERTSKIIIFLACLSFLISSMCILAISSFYIQQKAREISIRKICGAKTKEVLTWLILGFVKWIGLAFVFAIPISWYAYLIWQEGMIFKADISWIAFLLAGSFVLISSLIIIYWRSIKIASLNPREIVKYE